MIKEQEAHLGALRPFPGLRSFTSEEAQFFFGREGQSDEILRRLETARFVAVVGTSGCGKSSLVRAGLLPALRGGYAAGAGSGWQIADLHPGGDPLGNLACALNESGATSSLDAGTLRSASAAVVRAIAQARAGGLLADDTNILILVDQFEELFRYEVRPESATADRDEKARFVALLLEAARAQRIFVVLTLRAEFLGDCTQFRDLPEAINRGQYLVPRMTRLQRRAAIEGPVRMAGARISPHLVQRLLNDLGEDPDQLPVLQNALMRIWNEWVKWKEPEKEIQFEHYAAIGTTPEGTTTLKAALDRHAEEALAEAKQRLGQTGESLVKGIFLRLRGRDDKGRETRIPASIANLCAVTGADLGSVQIAVDCFRDDAVGRTFLTPFKSKIDKFKMADEIDLTHESLLRCWTTLKDRWAPEEEESKRIYVDLVRRAEAEGASQNLLRGSLLERVSEWWEKRQPNAAWAARYAPGFEAAKKYLFASRNRDRYEQRRSQFFVVLATVLAAGLLVALSYSLTAREKGQQTLVHLLASRAALAVTEDGSGPATGLLLAAESLKRSPTPEAQAVAIRALSLLPPPLASLPAPRSRQVAFGAQGTLLAFLEPGGVLRIWDSLDMKLRTPTPLLAGVRSFAFSRHAEILAASTESGSLVIMDAAAGKEVARFSCSGTRPALAISSSGLVVAALCAGEIHVRKTDASWSESRAVPVHPIKGEWSQLALDDEGAVLALGGVDKSNEGEEPGPTLTLVSLASGQQIGQFDPDERISAMIFLPNALGEVSLAFGGESGSVQIWSHLTSTSTEQAPEEARTVFRRSVAITDLSRDAVEEDLIAGYQDGVARVWDLDQDREVARLVGGSGPLLSVALSDSVGQAFVIGQGLSLQAWNLKGLKDSISLEGVASVGFFTDIPLLVYDERRTGYAILDLRQRTVSGPWNGPPYPVAVAPGGTSVAIRLYAGERTYGLSLADFSARRIGAPLWPQPVPIGGIMGLPVFSPDGRYLAGFVRELPHLRRPAGSFGLFVWSAANGRQEVYRPAEQPRSPRAPTFCFTPDSRRILIVSRDGRLKDLPLDTAERGEKDFALAPERRVTALAFSPNGSLLVTVASEESSGPENGEPTRSKIRVRSYPAGQLLTSFEQTSTVRLLSFSQDSQYLMSAGGDRSVVVWGLEKAQQEAQFLSDRPVRAIAFTRDGKAAVVDTDSLTFYPWKAPDLVAEACRRVRHNLTGDEWNIPGEEYSKTCPDLP